MNEVSISDNRNKPLVVLSGPGLSIVVASLGTSMVAVTLPELSEYFQGQDLSPTLVVSVYILATTALIIPVGRAGDLFGKRTVLFCSLCLYILGAFLAFEAPTLPMLIAGRFIQGTGAAGMMAMPLAMVRDLVPSGQVGRWMGAIGTMSAIGTAAGPAVGGAIVAAFGWRAVYLMQIPLALAALALCLLFIQNQKPETRRQGIDFPGAGALVLFLMAVTFLVSHMANGLDGATVLLAAIACGAIVAFFLIEKRTTSPIIPLDLLRSGHLQVSLAMNGIVSLVMMGILVVGPFFLTGGLGLTTAQMGLTMSVGPISSALSGIPAGRLTERIGAGRAVLVGASAMVIATAMMAGLPYVFGLGGFILAFMLLAPGYQVFLAALNTSVMERASEQNRGVTSGVLSLSRNFGFILGAGAVSAIFWSFVRADIGTVEGGQQTALAMAGTFAFCCALTLGVAVLASRLHRDRNNIPQYENGHS
ncbi:MULTISPECIES: MFS transporter [unclassified Phaeobacter]